MHYYLYEIRNNINNKIYVGVHKTKVLDDGYMGSGKVIKSAIKKYGLNNFTKTILETFESSDEMYSREKEVVNNEFLLRDDVYNLMCGGHGGFDFIISSGQHRSNFYRGVPLAKEHIEKTSCTLKRRYDNGELEYVREKARENATINNPMFDPKTKQKVIDKLTGVPKSEEHRKALSDSLLGKNTGRKHPNRKKRSPVVYETVVCPHCSSIGKSNVMFRWHFDNCKFTQLT